MPKPITQNTLFYGDNLPILREHVPDESIDLIYLDPPFNSNRSYNVLFKNERGEEAEAQIAAFDDTWHWNAAAERTFHELIQNAPAHVVAMLGALREFVSTNQMMDYLTMMAARLVELQRVLIQVKSGHVKSGDVRDLRGVVEREEAAIGVFVTLEPPSNEMITEAVSAGYFQSKAWQKDYPRIQILTVEDLLAGKGIDMPPSAYGTFKQAEKVKKQEGKQGELPM